MFSRSSVRGKNDSKTKQTANDLNTLILTLIILTLINGFPLFCWQCSDSNASTAGKCLQYTMYNRDFYHISSCIPGLQSAFIYQLIENPDNSLWPEASF